MEENVNGERNNEPSIPPNYVSILQLQERWLKEKERKQTEREKEEKEEEEERKRKQQREAQRRRKEDRRKVEAEKQLKEVGEGVQSRKLEGKRSGQRNRRRSAGNSGRNEPGDGVEASRVEAEEPEVPAIVGENREDAAQVDERLPEIRRKKKKSGKKKKNQVRVEKDVVGGESNAPQENSQTECIQVDKETRRVYRPKVENAARERDVPTAEIEKKFEGIAIRDAGTFKSRTRLNRGNCRNWDNESPYQWPLRRSGQKGPVNATKVWVKKGQTDGDAGGSGAIR